MPYTKQTWVDQSTPLSPTRLNNMEAGISLANMDFMTRAARVALSTSSLAQAYTVYETDTNIRVMWTGTAWYKVGGAPEIIMDAPNGPSSGLVGNTSAYINTLSWNLPAVPMGGTMYVNFHGSWVSTNNAAALCRLTYNGTTTQVPGSVDRQHNNGMASVTQKITCFGYYPITSGTAMQVYLQVAADAAGAGVTVNTNSFKAWLI